MKCSVCGNEKNNGNFCAACGASITVPSVSASSKNSPKKKTWLLFLILGVSALFLFCGIVGSVFLYSFFRDNTDNKKEEQKESGNILSNTAWIEKNDGSYMCFYEDDTFMWAQDEEDLSDNYYAGTYEFRTSMNAVLFVSWDLADYGVTVDELFDLFERSDLYSLGDFVCIAAKHALLCCKVKSKSQMNLLCGITMVFFYWTEPFWIW